MVGIIFILIKANRNYVIHVPKFPPVSPAHVTSKLILNVSPQSWKGAANEIKDG